MAEKFDLAAVLASVSESDTAEQIVRIPIGDLHADEKNFYTITGIDELAENIELIGLQQPLRVRKDTDGKYTVTSGHRRLAALTRIVEDGNSRFAAVPCIVDQPAGSEAMEELRLIYANADTRKMTAADIAKQAERVEELLYKLQAEGVEFPGRMRDHVAKVCQVSASKLARLNAIKGKLIAPALKAFNNGNLAEATAYELSKHPLETQSAIWAAKKDGNVRWLYEGKVQRYAKSIAALKHIKCTKLVGGTCTNRDRMMARICSRDSYAQTCTTCCYDCNMLATCTSACNLASVASRKKALRDAAKADKAAAAEAAAEAERPEIEFRKKIWSRYAEALASSGATPEEVGGAIGYGKSSQYSALARNNIAPDAKITKDATLPFGYRVDADVIKVLCAAADTLHTSVDFLLGRDINVPAPEPAPLTWRTGTPPHSMRAVAQFDFDGTEKPITQICYWDGLWRFNRTGAVIDQPVARWFEVPGD